MGAVLIWLGLYALAVALSFLSEITYKKKSLGQVKGEAKSIFIKTTIMFLVMLVATYIYAYFGIGSH